MKYGFLDLLDQTLTKAFTYDYEMNWDKKNHAVEIFYLLEVENPGVAVTDSDNDADASSENILFEDVVVFYNPEKSKIDTDEYLVALPYDPKKGLSIEFVHYFVTFLQETADAELDDLMDFLQSDATEFTGTFDKVAFEAGRDKLTETTFEAYPRY